MRKEIVAFERLLIQMNSSWYVYTPPVYKVKRKFAFCQSNKQIRKNADTYNIYKFYKMVTIK